VVAENVFFYIIAVMMVVAAIRVVTSNNVVHAALWLVVVLGGAAAQYVLLAAPFVATTQVLVYIGAVTVLFLFGTMLTRAQLGRDRNVNNSHGMMVAGVFTALVIAGTLGYVLIDQFHAVKLPKQAAAVTTQQLSDNIFGPYLLPFWALSFVLLAAVVGAIVLARRD
jgi:NADH-quinone oxidoreductase subunit J